MGRKWNWLHGNGREWERKNPFPVISSWQLWRMMHIATILVATRGRIAGALLRLTLSLSTAGKHAAVLRITLTLSSMPPRESHGVPSMSFKKCPPPSWGNVGSTENTVSWAHSSPQPKRHLSRFSCSSSAHGCVRHTHTHTHTDRGTSLTIGNARGISDRWYDWREGDSFSVCWTFRIPPLPSKKTIRIPDEGG